MKIVSKKEGGANYSHVEFESLSDAYHFYKDVRSGAYNFKRSKNGDLAKEHTSDSYHHENGSDWTGFKNHQHFIDCLENGDMEKAQQVWNLATPEVIVRSIRRRGKWTDRGDFLDTQKLIRGELDKAWRTTHKRKADGGSRNVTLLVDLGANCSVTSEALGWRGVASLKIADTLTEAGYNVRLLGYSLGVNDCSGGTNHSLSTIPIKDFDEGLDVTKLAFIMCRAGFFRTVIFASRSAIADHIDLNVCSSLGRSRGLQDCDEGKVFHEWIYAEEGQMITMATVEGEKKAIAEMNRILAQFSPDAEEHL